MKNIPATKPKAPAWLNKRIASFGYAFEGIFYLIRTQRNAQIHVGIGLIATILGMLLQISQASWLALVLIITMVLAAEAANTAIEAVVDLASSQRHPLAKIAKDVAAGMVLLTAIGAIVVGCLIFVPPLWGLLF
jgi:diacylglycerol kinase (ATP)